jgi:hypothetical protein
MQKNAEEVELLLDEMSGYMEKVQIVEREA